METLWEIKKEVITPEEVVARINKLVESWAAEEKAEALQRAQHKDHKDNVTAQKDGEGFLSGHSETEYPVLSMQDCHENTFLFNVEADNLKELI